jgi:hypothetical protein
VNGHGNIERPASERGWVIARGRLGGRPLQAGLEAVQNALTNIGVTSPMGLRAARS